MVPDRTDHEGALAAAFVSLADTLVADFDVVDLLHRLTLDCVALLPIDLVALLLTDQRGNLEIGSASDQGTGLTELLALTTETGPGPEAFRTGRLVTAADLGTGDVPWPRFAAVAVDSGFGSAHALPLRLRAETVGSVTLLGHRPGVLSPADVRIAQALADVATIGILQERAVRHHEMLAEQLQSALNGRVLLEQAKGVLAERGGLDMAAAFEALHRHARSTSLRLGDLARSVVLGDGADAVLRDGAGRHDGNTSP